MSLVTVLTGGSLWQTIGDECVLSLAENQMIEAGSVTCCYRVCTRIKWCKVARDMKLLHSLAKRFGKLSRFDWSVAVGMMRDTSTYATSLDPALGRKLTADLLPSDWPPHHLHTLTL